MITKDGGKNVVAGNERVLRARLSDAKFFWDQDKKSTLEIPRRPPCKTHRLPRQTRHAARTRRTHRSARR